MEDWLKERAEGSLGVDFGLGREARSSTLFPGVSFVVILEVVSRKSGPFRGGDSLAFGGDLLKSSDPLLPGSHVCGVHRTTVRLPEDGLPDDGARSTSWD